MEKVPADYIEQKRQELGMAREDDLARVQAVLERWYPGQARAKRLHLGVLRVMTPSASVAAALRMRQLELVEACGLEGVRVAISIGVT